MVTIYFCISKQKRKNLPILLIKKQSVSKIFLEPIET
jgi:hypothetical protein